MNIWRKRAGNVRPPPAVNIHIERNGFGRRLTNVASKRDSFKNDVIAVTGSCGKTTTVAMIHAVLATAYTLPKPKPDANGSGGITSAIQSLFKSTDNMWLSEVALYSEGGMKPVLDLLKPTVKILTNLCNVHSSEFPSPEHYYKEKLSFLDDRSNVSLVVINNDDPRIRSYIAANWNKGFDWRYYVRIHTDLQKAGIDTEEKALRHWNMHGKKERRTCSATVKIMRCGTSPTDDIQILDYELQKNNISSRIRFRTPRGEICIILNAVGKAYAFNAGYAIACGIHFGIPLEKIVSALGAFSLYENRGSIHVFTKSIIYNHTYNFTSLAALTNLSDFATVNATATATKIIVLGPMLRETRDPQDKLYLSILQLALRITPHVIVYGTPEYLKNDYPKGIHVCASTNELVTRIASLAANRFAYIYLHTSSMLNTDYIPLFKLIEPAFQV